MRCSAVRKKRGLSIRLSASMLTSFCKLHERTPRTHAHTYIIRIHAHVGPHAHKQECTHSDKERERDRYREKEGNRNIVADAYEIQIQTDIDRHTYTLLRACVVSFSHALVFSLLLEYSHCPVRCSFLICSPNLSLSTNLFIGQCSLDCKLSFCLS